MAAFNIRIDGLSDLISKFDNLAGGAIDDALDDGLDEAGALTLPALQSNTPVDTGELRSSMFVEKVGKTVYIGPGDNLVPHYAADVEYGFHHWISGNFIEGQHYLERTAIEVHDVVVVLFKNKIIDLFFKK